MRFKLLTLLVAVVLGLAACGTAEDGNGGTEGSGGDDGTEGGGGGTALTVTAQDFSFEVEGVTLPAAGEDVAVTLVNEGQAPHTFSSEELGVDIEADAGAEAEGTFTVPDSGTMEFQCDIHPDQMTLTLTAGETAASDAGSGGSKSESESEGTGGGTDDYDY